MPKVTVIVPAYNAEPYIEQCTKSLLAQTLEDIELIFINDGSTDKTPQIIERLIQGHENAHLFNQENKGLYKTREIGLAKATGEYVGWCDADDFVEPQMYEKLYEAAIKNDSEMSYCDYSWFPEKIKTKEKWFREYQGKVDVNFVERNSQPWNKIVKRELLQRLEIGKHFVSCFDEIYIEVLLTAKNPVAVKEKLYNYRVSSSSMSVSYTNVSHYARFIKASEELKKVVHPIIRDNKYWSDYFEYRIIYYTLMTMLVAANAGDRKSYDNTKYDLNETHKQYKKNMHYWSILKSNFGVLKSIGITSCSCSYGWARLLAHISFGYR